MQGRQEGVAAHLRKIFVQVGGREFKLRSGDRARIPLIRRRKKEFDVLLAARKDILRLKNEEFRPRVVRRFGDAKEGVRRERIERE